MYHLDYIEKVFKCFEGKWDRVVHDFAKDHVRSLCGEDCGFLFIGLNTKKDPDHNIIAVFKENCFIVSNILYNLCPINSFTVRQVSYSNISFYTDNKIKRKNNEIKTSLNSLHIDYGMGRFSFFHFDYDFQIECLQSIADFLKFKIEKKQTSQSIQWNSLPTVPPQSANLTDFQSIQLDSVPIMPPQSEFRPLKFKVGDIVNYRVRDIRGQIIKIDDRRENGQIIKIDDKRENRPYYVRWDHGAHCHYEEYELTIAAS